MIELERNHLKDKIDKLLQQHMGADNCILMNEIYVLATGSYIVPNRRYDQTRIIRSIIKDLREDGHPIGIKPGSNGGYFTARNDEELEATIRLFHNRAISSLKQEAALKLISFSELLEQYELELSQGGES